jgi:hypothetical protein
VCVCVCVCGQNWVTASCVETGCNRPGLNPLGDFLTRHIEVEVPPTTMTRRFDLNDLRNFPANYTIYAKPFNIEMQMRHYNMPHGNSHTEMAAI